MNDNAQSPNAPHSYYDAHCHLDFMANAEEVARDAALDGTTLFANTVTPEGWVATRERFAEFPNVRVGFGMHPWWVGEWCAGGEGGEGAPDEAFLRRARRTEWLLNMHYHRRTCGLCALWRFERLGVSAYKVVGRGDDVDDLVADAGLVVRNAALARTCATEGEYLRQMERPREPETLCGMNGLGCYYPEIARR